MSAGNHKVQRIVLELTNSEAGSYQEDEREFSSLVNGSLTSALEELFDETSTDNITVRIPKLELDLGTFQRPVQKELLVSLFKKKLREQLQPFIEKQQTAPAKEQGTEADALIYFLKHGGLPWWSTALPSLTLLEDPDFKARLIRYLRSGSANAGIERLVKQFRYKELMPLVFELAGPANRALTEQLETLLSNLTASGNFQKRRSGNALLKKRLLEVISKKGSISSFPEFISNYISEAPELRPLSFEEKISYFGNGELAELPEILALKDQAEKEIQSIVFSNSKEQSEAADKEATLFHYLSFGSLPAKNSTLTKTELDFLLTELILKRPGKLQALIATNTKHQQRFITILLQLPQQALYTLLNKLPTVDPLHAALKEQLAHGTTSTNEIKVIASVRVLNTVLKKNNSSSAEWHVQAKSFLSAAETVRLKEFIRKHEPGFTDLTEQTATAFERGIEERAPQKNDPENTKQSNRPDDPAPAHQNELPDAVYFADLLSYLFEHNSWPWWASQYLNTYQTISGNEQQPDHVIRQFQQEFPAEFSEFSKTLLNTSEKPSLLLSKLDGEPAQLLLDKALPFYKNSLSDTIEAVLELIFRHKPSGLNVSIVTQQFLLFIIDQKKETRASFKELINRVITAIAAVIKAPLWEIYGLLAKNYSTLALKNAFSKEEAVSVFAYHEQLEEQYSQQLQITQRPGDPVAKSFSDIPFISGKHEVVLLHYISGNAAALKSFPSAWALGQFIREQLKTSPTLQAALQTALKGTDFFEIHHIVQLEQLSADNWIGTLLPGKEFSELQQELAELLSSIIPLDKTGWSHALRSALIKTRIWQNSELTAEKLNAVLTVVSEEYSIPAVRLKAEFLRSLTKKEKKNSLLNYYFEKTEFSAPAVEEENKSFVNRLKEIEQKKQLDQLQIFFKDIKDPATAAQLLSELRSIKDRPALLQWTATLSEHEIKKQVQEIVYSIESVAAISAFIKLIEESFAPVLEANLKSLLEKKIKPAYVQQLLDMIFNLPEFTGKTELVLTVEKLTYSDKKALITEVEKTVGIPEKRKIVDFISASFPEKSAIVLQQELVLQKQKAEFKKWNIALDFELDLPETLITAYLTENEKINLTGNNIIFQSLLDKKSETGSAKDNRSVSGNNSFDSVQTIQPATDKQADAKEKRSSDALSEKLKTDVQDRQKREEQEHHPATGEETSLITSGEKEDQLRQQNRTTDEDDHSPVSFEEKDTISSSSHLYKKEKQTNEQTSAAAEQIAKELFDKEIVNRLKQPGEFSPESISELLLYFLFNLELPWWSPIKELAVFEKLVQQTAGSSPFLLKKKLEEAAGYHESYFKTIGAGLLSEENNSTSEFLSEAKLENVLHNDLHYLSQTGLGSDIEISALVHELVSQLQNISPGRQKETVQAVFRKIAARIVFSLNPDATISSYETKALSGEKSELALALQNDWLQTEKDAKTEFNLPLSRQQKLLKEFLSELEKKQTTDALQKGISVTQNLFLIAGSKNTYSLQELTATWLYLLEQFTQVKKEKIIQDVLNASNLAAAGEGTTANSDAIPDQLKITMDNSIATDPAGTTEKADSSFEIAELFKTLRGPDLFLPHSNTISAISLMLSQLEVLSPEQRSTALRLAASLLQVNELHGDLQLPLKIIITYLDRLGVSKTKLTGALEELQIKEIKPELRLLFNSMKQLADGTTGAGDNYLASVKRQQKNPAGSITVTETIDALIKQLQDKAPVLDRIKLQLQADAKPAPRRAQPEQQRNLETDPEGRLYIPNAGLVILWPFLSRLFFHLKYTENGKFIDAEKQLRAVHLTQYLVGFTEDHPEYTLLLNKLLCGVELTEPVERTVYLTDEEKTEARNLLQAVLAQWKEVNNTSPENFQRTFLQREGVMYQKDGNWYVKVNHTPFDILLLKLPWGLSMIKYSWNNYLIFTEWKAMN